MWDQQRTALDVAFRTKQGAPKGFGQLEILTSRGDGYRTYTGTQQFLCEALYLRTFVQGTGLLIGFNLEKWKGAAYVEGPGHAIAMHYQDPSTFVLFDPNLGVYSFKEQARALRAVLALVEEGYNTPQKTDHPSFTPVVIATYFAIRGWRRDSPITWRHPVLRESWATWKQSAESAPKPLHWPVAISQLSVRSSGQICLQLPTVRCFMREQRIRRIKPARRQEHSGRTWMQITSPGRVYTRWHDCR